jgi:multidrug resistance efflux pump
MTTTLPRPDIISDQVRAAVDEVYLTDPGHALIAIDHATADPSEQVLEWELDTATRTVWEAGYMVGFAAAGTELQAEIHALRAQLEQAQHDADRYYAEMCRRPAVREPDRVSFAELSRRRGEHDRAARADQHAAALATQVRTAA